MPDGASQGGRPGPTQPPGLTLGRPEDMQALGERVGRVATAGDRFLLVGAFGTGKTTFVQGLARGLGVKEPVSSPSFVLENQYRGSLPLYHVDLYRLERLEPAFLDEMEEHLFAEGVAAVEWPTLLPPHVWDGATVLRFERAGELGRRVEMDQGSERIAGAFSSPAPA